MPYPIIGFDVGQEKDPASLCGLDQFRRATTDSRIHETVYMVQRLERALRVGYRDLCRWCKQRVSDWSCVGAPVALDYTGLGRPFLEMLREQEIGSQIRPISITGGHSVTEWEEYGFRGYNVPKKDLVSLVKLLIQRSRLGIDPRLKDAKALGEELLAFEFKLSEAGNIIYGARSGKHDDLVLSVALGCWLGENTPLGWDGTLGMGGAVSAPQGVFIAERKPEQDAEHDSYRDWRKSLGHEDRMSGGSGVPDIW